jgi:S1-C subfamily serine protease
MTDTAPTLDALSDALADLVDRTAPSVLALRGRGGRAIAAATVWRDGTLAVTAAHALRHSPAAVTLVGAGGVTVDATVVGTDASTDLALLRLPESRPAIGLGDATAVRAGQIVVAVGRAGDGDPVASWGLVNRASGPWQTWLGGQIDRLIRLDGGLYEGLSGAPLVDAQGCVVGIGSAALLRSYGIVVPAPTVERIVDVLLAQGHVGRGFLGIAAQPATLPDGGGGLLVTALRPDGAAQRGGLMVGDLIVRVGVSAVPTLQALRAALAGQPGRPVDIELMRGGVAQTLPVVVDEWPRQHRPC